MNEHTKLPDTVFQSPDTPRARTTEQDASAGGRKNRVVTTTDGRRLLASIALKRVKSPYRAWAYLRYKDRRTVTRYIGNATADTRAEALEIAWRIVHSRGLLRPKD